MEVAVGYVDGDALLALGTKAVGELSEVDGGLLFARCGDGPGDGANLVFVDVARVVEQAADKGGLAIVHAARGAETEEVFGFFRSEKLLDDKDRTGSTAPLGRFGWAVALLHVRG